MAQHQEKQAVRLTCAGLAESIKVRLFLSGGASVKRLTTGGKAIRYRIEKVGASRYAVAGIKGTGVHELALEIRKKISK